MGADAAEGQVERKDQVEFHVQNITKTFRALYLCCQNKVQAFRWKFVEPTWRALSRRFDAEDEEIQWGGYDAADNELRVEQG